VNCREDQIDVSCSAPAKDLETFRNLVQDLLPPFLTWWA